MHLTTRRLRRAAAGILALAGIFPVVAARASQASAAGEPTYLFVNENSSGSDGNVVQSYGIAINGTQVSDTLNGSYPTGHPGSGTTLVASPKAAFSYDMTTTVANLYALNLGDSTVSVFAINPYSGQLTYKATSAPLGVQAGAVNGVTAIKSTLWERCSTPDGLSPSRRPTSPTDRGA